MRPLRRDGLKRASTREILPIDKAGEIPSRVFVVKISGVGRTKHDEKKTTGAPCVLKGQRVTITEDGSVSMFGFGSGGV